MAKTEDLPIYRTCNTLLQQITEACRHFPKDFKTHIGEALLHETTNLVVHVYRANSSFQKRARELNKALESVRVIELLVRTCCELKVLPVKKHAHISGTTQSVSKQLTGWKNSC